MRLGQASIRAAEDDAAATSQLSFNFDGHTIREQTQSSQLSM